MCVKFEELAIIIPQVFFQNQLENFMFYCCILKWPLGIFLIYENVLCCPIPIFGIINRFLNQCGQVSADRFLIGTGFDLLNSYNIQPIPFYQALSAKSKRI